MSKWKYYYENIGTDLKVATLINNNGMEVLDVFEGAHAHYTKPRYKFLQMFSVNYTREDSLLEELKFDESKPLAEKKLEVGCKEIKHNYKEQVKTIKVCIRFGVRKYC